MLSSSTCFAIRHTIFYIMALRDDFSSWDRLPAWADEPSGTEGPSFGVRTDKAAHSKQRRNQTPPRQS